MISGNYRKDGKHVISGREWLKARSEFAETISQRALKAMLSTAYLIIA